MERLRFQYHPIFGHQRLPGVKARYLHEGGGFLVRTNGAGFRSDHEFEPEKPAGVFRILLFGDSYTEGHGVSNQYRYGDVLETLIPGTEVFNYGLGGTGTDQQYLIYQENGAQVEHDAVVVGVLVENIRRIVARTREFHFNVDELLCFAKPYFTLENGKGLRLHNCPVPKGGVPREAMPAEERRYLADAGVRSRVASFLGPTVSRAVRKILKPEPYPGYKNARSEAWGLMRAILKAWADDVAPKPFVVMPIPMHYHLEGLASKRHYRARFRELAQEPGINVHDPWEDVVAHSTTELRGFRFSRDPHPTPEYHRALADSLRPVIERLVAARRTV
jgi:carbamoyltransferase